uniref:Ig-like domain-containing protein n=1 Tax=Timema shepardi TaxID=629360 RepID=A0A7R9B6T2_TIMSH|nr:unnamed protein product [Timema shepardi]
MNICRCQRTPFISHVSQQQVADTGGSVQLHCSAPYSTGYPVLWIKTDGSVPLSTGCARILPDTRYVVRCDRDTPTYILEVWSRLRPPKVILVASTMSPISVLQDLPVNGRPKAFNLGRASMLNENIHQLQETDGGWYQCLVLLDSTTRIVAESEVLVRTPPLILDTSTRSVVVDEGGNVTLECHAKGFPTPRIAWRRKDSRTLPGGKAIHRGNTLLIQGVTRSDRGSYLCVADNGVGRGARRSVTVEVHFQPEVRALKPRVGQALGYEMDLECVVEASPPAVKTTLTPLNCVQSFGALHRESKAVKHACTKGCIGARCATLHTSTSRSTATELTTVNSKQPTGTSRSANTLSYITGRVSHYYRCSDARLAPMQPVVQACLNSFALCSLGVEFTIHMVSQFPGSDDVIRSTLRVSNIEKFHIGLYECTATNQLGSNKTEMLLFETVNPTCPPSCEKLYFDDLAT